MSALGREIDNQRGLLRLGSGDPQKITTVRFQSVAEFQRLNLHDRFVSVADKSSDRRVGYAERNETCSEKYGTDVAHLFPALISQGRCSSKILSSLTTFAPFPRRRRIRIAPQPNFSSSPLENFTGSNALIL